jgi:hypothetical protein
MIRSYLLLIKLVFTCRISSSCEITTATRRHCSACRLKKCFRQGMKRELIRSLSAINHATSVAMPNLLQRQPLRSTTVRLNLIKEKIFLFYYSDRFTYSFT